MGVKLILCAIITISLGTKSFGTSIPQDDFVRCAESCLKINPYDNLTHHDPLGPQLVKHCAKLTTDGKCECDWEKILTDSGTCVCRNPYQIINENNQCICYLDKCKAPMKNCNIIKEANLENCTCPEYICDAKSSSDICPDDSYRSNQTQDDGCLCYPCRAVTCKQNQKAVVIRKGTHKPGTCCDLYRCDDLNLTKTCEKDGHVYENGKSWLAGECTIYRCENGIIFQEIKEGCDNTQPCFSKGLVYEHNQSWLEDECTNCTCNNGNTKCMAHFCKDLPAVTIRPKEDCQYLLGCRKKCAFGYRLNRQGCEVCKCRQPDQKKIQEILLAVNCTLESCDLLHVLPSNCNSLNNVSVGECPKCAEPYSFSAWIILFIGLITFLSMACVVLLFLYCKERKRTGTLRVLAPPESHKYIPMFDANLNTEKPVLCKNVELKDFH